MYFGNFNNGDDKANAKYKKKYRNLKQIIKGYVIENAALCDEVAKIQENILIVKEERKFLLKKVLENESEMDSNHHRSGKIQTGSSFSNNGSQAKQKKLKSPDKNGIP